MANTVRVYYVGVSEHNNSSRIFQLIGFWRIRNIWVDAYEGGFATIDPIFCNIYDFAVIVANCFDDESNFAIEVMKAYNCDTPFVGIKFTFNGITLTVTRENANADKICQEWYTIRGTGFENQMRKDWLETPEGQEHIAKSEAARVRGKNIRAELFHIDETIEMEFKDKKSKNEWNKMEKNWSNWPSGIATLEYARHLAKYIQKLIEDGKAIDEIAEKSSRYCDVTGIFDLQYEYAINLLIQNWKYGEELRKWYDKNNHFVIAM